MFRQDFTCPALLKDCLRFTYTGLSPALAGLSRPFRLSQTNHWPVPLSLATTDGISLMSVPPGTEMFQFPGFASPTYVFRWRYPKGVGCPIRTSTDQRLLAAPRGFSQRATSFIASWCQGIHRMPFSCSRATGHSEKWPDPMHRNHPRNHSENRSLMDPCSAHNMSSLNPRDRGSQASARAPPGHPVRHATARAQRRTKT